MPLLFLLFLAAVSHTSAHDLSYYLKQFSTDELNNCNTGNKISAMSRQEQDVVLISNLARQYPKKFASVFIDHYVAHSDLYKSNSPYVQSLKRELLNQQPLQVLQVHPVLNKTAKDHANYCGNTGHMGHHGFDQRNRTVTKSLQHLFFGENCSYLRTNALDFVMDLLIDESVRDLGHRKNILHPKFTNIGVSIQPFKKGEYCLVQQFSAP
jgi:hypothetical protein